LLADELVVTQAADGRWFVAVRCAGKTEKIVVSCRQALVIWQSGALGYLVSGVVVMHMVLLCRCWLMSSLRRKLQTGAGLWLSGAVAKGLMSGVVGCWHAHISPVSWMPHCCWLMSSS
jgi:hypothetical protein